MRFMSAPKSLQQLNLKQFADRFRGEMVPLGNRFSYFCAAVSLSEEDLREYLDEPVAALPPVIGARLPQIQILLVPYLRRKVVNGGARKQPDLLVATEKPSETSASLSGRVISGKDAVLAFAIKDSEVADYHYRFYRAIAELTADSPGGIHSDFIDLLRKELRSSAHGEVDEASWKLKQDLTATDMDPARPSRRFRQYARQSFIDTLTLYLHGICCDIDVETGPRQLASNLMRRRLLLLRSMYPPPEGYAVFPEDLRNN